LAHCSGGLHIGSGYTIALDTYWAGLANDVRIYNRAVKPWADASESLFRSAGSSGYCLLSRFRTRPVHLRTVMTFVREGDLLT